MNKFGIKVYYNIIYIDGILFMVNSIVHCKYEYNKTLKNRIINWNNFGIKLHIINKR